MKSSENTGKKATFYNHHSTKSLAKMVMVGDREKKQKIHRGREGPTEVNLEKNMPQTERDGERLRSRETVRNSLTETKRRSAKIGT